MHMCSVLQIKILSCYIIPIGHNSGASNQEIAVDELHLTDMILWFMQEEYLYFRELVIFPRGLKVNIFSSFLKYMFLQPISMPILIDKKF